MSSDDPLGGILAPGPVDDGERTRRGFPIGGGGLQGFVPFLPVRPLTGNINVGSGSESSPVTEVRLREMPFRGWLATFFVDWEDGTNQLVGVQLKRGRPNQPGQIILPFNPEDEFMSLNDMDREEPLWVPVNRKDPFTVTVQNRDSAGHTIPFIMQVVRSFPFLEEQLPDPLLPPPPEVRPQEAE